MDDRLDRLEEQVMDLRLNERTQNELLKTLSIQLKAQAAQQKETNDVIKTLTDTLNRSRGALAALGFVSAALGTISGWVAHIWSSGSHG